MGRQPCSICSSPVAAEINEALQRREKLRDLEARSGFSRSALSRHSRKCLPREVLREHKETKKLDSYNSRLWVKLPGEVDSRLMQDVQPPPWWRKKPETITNVRLVVQFEGGNFDKSPADVQRELDEASTRQSEKPAE